MMLFMLLHPLTCISFWNTSRLCAGAPSFPYLYIYRWYFNY